MTTYFVDPKKGKDYPWRDGLTPATAFSTYERAVAASDRAERKKQIALLPRWRRILWPWLTNREIRLASEISIHIETDGKIGC